MDAKVPQRQVARSFMSSATLSLFCCLTQGVPSMGNFRSFRKRYGISLVRALLAVHQVPPEG